MKQRNSKIREAGIINPESKCNVIIYEPLVGRTNGSAASVSAAVLNSMIGKWALIGKLKNSSGITHLSKLTIKDTPIENNDQFYSSQNYGSFENTKNLSKNEINADCDSTNDLLISCNHCSPYKTIFDYIKAYKSSSTTPKDVCQRIIDLAQNKEIKKINCIKEMNIENIMKMAEASNQRYSEGLPLSNLDGIPFFVTDEIHVRGYKVTFGTNFIADTLEKDETTVIQRLIDAGAILMGITKSSYAGLNCFGSNCTIDYGSTKNPWNTEFYCGGSNNGAAAVVASGLAPFSIGIDLCGSTRVPASFCGLVALRSTYRRISDYEGGERVSNGSVISPITLSSNDSAIIYSIIAGPDDKSPSTHIQPTMHLPDFNCNIESLRFAYDNSFTEIAAEPEIIDCFNKLIENMKSEGLNVFEHVIPEMHEIKSAGNVIVLREKLDSLTHNKDKKKILSKITCSNGSVMLGIADSIKSEDYTQACRQKHRTCFIADELFKICDIYLTPMTGYYPLRIEPGDETNGILHDIAIQKTLLYSSFSFVSGCPSITIFGDVGKNNIPIGIQLQAQWWNEKTLLECANYFERHFCKAGRSTSTIFSPL